MPLLPFTLLYSHVAYELGSRAATRILKIKQNYKRTAWKGSEKMPTNQNNTDLNARLARCTAEIVKALLTHPNPSSVNLSGLRNKFAKKHGIPTLPKITDILAAIPAEEKDKLKGIMVRPVRSASGVAVVAVMCKPHRCPHIAMTGNVCVYCGYNFAALSRETKLGTSRNARNDNDSDSDRAVSLCFDIF